MPASTSRLSRRAAASKKKPLVVDSESEPEVEEEEVESELEVVPTPKRGVRGGMKAAEVKPRDRAKANQKGKRADKAVSAGEEDGDTLVKAPLRRGRRTPVKKAKSPTPEEIGDDEEEQDDQDEEEDDKIANDNMEEGEEGGEEEEDEEEGEEEEEVKMPASRKRKATEQEVVAPLQPQLGTPARTPSTPSIRQSRQTTPVAPVSRTILPQGTPKPKSNMRAAAEGSMPTSENKRSLETAFPEGTGNTPDRRRSASMAFPEGGGYTTSHRKPSQAAAPRLANVALGSPSKTMAIGSPSRARRSATPQVLQPVAEPQSPSLSQQIPPSAQVLPKVPQMPPSSQHVPYTQVAPPVTQPQLPQPEPNVPSQRTVITHLVMTNFKSYAGRQEVGPFHPSFSSVVGPNGSGKSNVIDSLLFVFGFRASKMRQGKISALIHNSANHMDLQFCEVEVHFQEVIDLVCPP